MGQFYGIKHWLEAFIYTFFEKRVKKLMHEKMSKWLP